MKVQAELYQDDCIEIMQSILDESVNMVLCDLIYGTPYLIIAWVPVLQAWRH